MPVMIKQGCFIPSAELMSVTAAKMFIIHPSLTHDYGPRFSATRAISCSTVEFRRMPRNSALRRNCMALQLLH